MTDVSVLTPSYGYGRFIEDGILSVAGQKAISVQHIVQDAGSTDETLDILKRFEDDIEWFSEPDEGQSDALNKGLARARGRWIAWLNADEFYLPGGLAALMKRGEQISADVVYGDNVFVDDEGRLLRLLPQHPFDLRTLRTYGCFIASSSVIFRRSVLSSAPWDISVRMMMDWDLYLRLAHNGAKFATVKYPVGAFRRHGDQITARPSAEFADEYQMLFKRHGIDPSSRKWGPWLHRGSKLVSGAYGRQLRARRMNGRDLRWFIGEEGRESFAELLRVVYGRKAEDPRPSRAGA